jgi:glycosyltransferase involved in cell wall biosynthesis
MTSVYREADILVLTSDREGSPNVILEAMASGLPIVATKIGGVPEIVQHGLTGYLTNVDDLEAMTSVLLELVDNPSLRNHIGRAGREYVSTHHSLERLPDLLEDLYEAATA